MRTYDLTPVYRQSVGFDRLFNELFDGLSKAETTGYPPYNIEVLGENDYRITLAVAGFSEDELEIEVTDRALRISGSRKEDDGVERKFLHQGIAGRSFERRFQLADHLKVRGATMENGLLNIELQREIPEAMKPRKIAIGKTDEQDGPRVIASNDAA
ncbi:Hsp20 family protein [Parvularcula lutaonensis]|uniref:Hsp20 family protein n=1 Tax=Parvularcula lutaonensis TaxID=491923 RepID=A0ABV7M8H4_9PROT|nr:Hsp20 family protein [Parvularcula lutaonensis]GGY44777.1 heat-shock protein IbpA [Parvularcula lutaonensis]